jgi:hypothetical protein
MKNKIFGFKKIILYSTLLLFGIMTFMILRQAMREPNTNIYRKYIKWESVNWDINHPNKILLVCDTAYNLEGMHAYEKEGNLKEQNPDSIYLLIKKVFNKIDRTTINDFYDKNKNKVVLDSKSLAHPIKLRNLLKYFDKNPDTLKIHFSQVGFNKDRTQAMVYVSSSETGYYDFRIYFYKYNFGLWLKEADILINGAIIDFFPFEAPPLPPDLKPIYRNHL